jgi:uncharacterized protein YjbI with pentapeptide repeats
MKRDDITTLRRGVLEWNAWRRRNPETVPDLDGAILSGMSLRGADLRGAELRDASFNGADLTKARLQRAALNGADFRDAILRDANFSGADLRGAHFKRVDLSHANLTGADLRGAALIDANLSNAKLVECKVYGLTAWNLEMTPGTIQRNLLITETDDVLPATVHELEAAQLVHLLLRGSHISRLIDAVNSKLVLVLGRFKPRTKRVLDAVHDRLRAKRGYVSVMFDFRKPQSRDYMESVLALASLSRFIIADLTDAKIVLEELSRVVPQLAIPVQPIMRADAGLEPTTIRNLRVNNRSVLPTYRYASEAKLLEELEREVIRPADQAVRLLLQRRVMLDPFRLPEGSDAESSHRRRRLRQHAHRGGPRRAQHVRRRRCPISRRPIRWSSNRSTSSRARTPAPAAMWGAVRACSSRSPRCLRNYSRDGRDDALSSQSLHEQVSRAWLHRP